mmetsp:Transcript_22193/g.61492  ORF Transcript_22193/g.61492 Transcript_22193/m.61492 type:complete len:156 (-) Transcript_22193:83-550(-)
MGNDMSSAQGWCQGVGYTGLGRYEERFDHIPEPMPVATSEALKHDRIDEWAELGSLTPVGDASQCWYMCGADGSRRVQNIDAPVTDFRLVSMKGSSYLVADTPDGGTLMSTAKGDGRGEVWLGDADNDLLKPPLRAVWDPAVRNGFLTDVATEPR